MTFQVTVQNCQCLQIVIIVNIAEHDVLTFNLWTLSCFALFAQTKSKRYKIVLNYITTNSLSYNHEYEIHGATYDSPSKMTNLSLILFDNADNLQRITLESYLSMNFHKISVLFKI